METKRKTKGSWGLRFSVVVLGVVLGVLFYWFLCFIEDDIGTMAGPDWQVIRSRHVAAELDEKQKSLSSEVDALQRKIQVQSEQQQLLNSATNNLQNTINQLLSIQKESVAKNLVFSEKSIQTLQESQAAFLKNQEKNQEYSREIAELTRQKREQEDALKAVNETIKAQEQEAQKDFQEACRRHWLKTAVLKLAFLVPIFLAASFFFMKYRISAYRPLVWAVFLAAFVKIALVAHEYFPTRYFKYIAWAVVTAIVIRILIYLIRMIAAPKKDLLVKQYQQHYDKCICPVCSKPIRTGPLRYIGAFGKKEHALFGQPAAAQQEPYICPSCGTKLYDKCASCGGIRHILLPYCEHCGAEMGI